MLNMTQYENILFEYNWTGDGKVGFTKQLPTTGVSPVNGFYTLTFSFISNQSDITISGDYLTADEEYINFKPLQAKQIAAAEVVLHQATSYDYTYSTFFGDIAKVNFQNGHILNSELIIGSNDTQNTQFKDTEGNPKPLVAGYEYPWGPSVSWVEGRHGDIWLNEDYDPDEDGVPDGWEDIGIGSYGFTAIMHELAHALGLNHPTDSVINNMQYTIMSDQPLVGMNPSGSGNTIFPSGLQILDIAALQEIYGRNYDTRLGNTTYDKTGAFASTRPDEAFIYTIWDGNGIGDKIDASGYADPAIIDLRQGAFSSIGKNALGAIAVDNVAIAYHAIIEDAKGTSAGDILIGNAWHNVLEGGAGDDRIFGDGLTLDNDPLVGQIYDNDAGFGATPSDHDSQNPGLPAALDKSGADALLGGAGNDHLYGGAGNDILDGGAGLDTVGYSKDAAGSGITVNLNASGDGTVTNGIGETDTLRSIENVTGTGLDDTFNLGSPAGRVIDGGEGHDRVIYTSPDMVEDARTGAVYDAHGLAEDHLSGIEFVSANIAFLLPDTSVNSPTFVPGGRVGSDYSASVLSGEFNLLFSDNITIGPLGFAYDGQTHGTFVFGGIEHDGVVTDGHNFNLNINALLSQERARPDRVIVGTNQGDTFNFTESPISEVGIHNLVVETGTGNDTLNFSGWRPIEFRVEYRGGNDVINGVPANLRIDMWEGIVMDDVIDVTSSGSSALLTIDGFGTLEINSLGPQVFANIVFKSGGSIRFDDTGVTFLGTSGFAGAIEGTWGDDTITGRGWDGVTLYGKGGNDFLYGSEGDDTIFGGVGFDYLQGGIGNDTLIGGVGDDTNNTAGYRDAFWGIIADLGNGTVSDDGFGTSDTLVNIANIVGSGFDDLITGSGGNDSLFADAGDDTLDGGVGFDYLEGGAGNDTLIGGIGDDTNNTAGYRDAIWGIIADLESGTVFDDGFGTSDTLVNIANIAGSGFDDIITGSGAANEVAGEDGADTLNGLGGDDLLFAGAGDDTLYGEDDNDTLNGGEGEDLLFGGTEDDTLSGMNGHDVLDGEDGNDILNGGAGIDRATYASAMAAVTVSLATTVAQNTLGAGIDTLVGIENLTGSAFNDTLTGNAADNVIDGGGGNDTLTGLDGNDILYGGWGDDSLNGGAGTDTVSYEFGTVGVTVNLATTTAQNTIGAGTDTLSNFENLSGSNFNDTLTGDGKSNLLIGGLGDDILNGAGATDTVSYETATTGVTVSLALAGAQNTIGAGIDTLSNFESLRGSNFNDTLTGNGGTNILTGGLGNDVLDGDAGSDTASYETSAAGVTVSLAIAGSQNTIGAGTDTLSNFENLRGSNFNDTLVGNAASNVLIGHLGNDILDGGAGTDTASYETSTTGVTVSLAIAGGQNTVGAGTDTLINFEHLRGGVANDTLIGNGGSNIITGGLGNDVLDGGAGTDTASYDTAFGGVTVNLGLAGAQNTVNAGTDTLSNFENLKGSIHNDTLTGNAASNTIIGDQGNDILNGDAGIDTASYETAKVGVTVSLAIAGTQNTVGAGTDTLSNFENLRGGNFNDTLTGNAGANQLTGGLGNDTMTGNSGADSFVFNTALNATTNTDTITDFAPVDDTLVLENAIFTKFVATGTIPAGTFVANAGGVAGDANDFLLYDTNTGELFYDADGDGAGAKVEFVTLVGIPALTVTDFSVI